MSVSKTSLLQDLKGCGLWCWRLQFTVDIVSACILTHTHTHLLIDQAGRLLSFLYQDFLVTFFSILGIKLRASLHVEQTIILLSSA